MLNLVFLLKSNLFYTAALCATTLPVELRMWVYLVWKEVPVVGQSSMKATPIHWQWPQNWLRNQNFTVLFSTLRDTVRTRRRMQMDCYFVVHSLDLHWIGQWSYTGWVLSFRGSDCFTPEQLNPTASFSAIDSAVCADYSNLGPSLVLWGILSLCWKTRFKSEQVQPTIVVDDEWNRLRAW